MSVECIVRCDRCSAVLDRDRNALRVESGPGRHRLPEGLDLCPACLDALLFWLAAGHATAGTPAR
jgi:hypothetical protein